MPIGFDGKHGSFDNCVSHFTNKVNKRTGKNFTSEEASKVCGKMQSRQEKQNKFCAFGKLQLKDDDKDFYVSGYVATSHPDRAAEGEFVGDIIPKPTLQKIVDQINNRYKPEAGAVSERHDYIRQKNMDLPLAGVAVGPASLVQLEDGEWGAHVETILSKTNPRYEEVKTNVEQGVYPGFSIEYENDNFIPTIKEGKKYRQLMDIDLQGFGYANRRNIANPHAEYTSFGYKEIIGVKEKHMYEDDEEDEDKKSKKKKSKGEDKMENKAEEKEFQVSEEEFKAFTAFKEMKVKEAEMDARIKEFAPKIKEAVQVEMKERINQRRPIFSDQEDKVQFKEFDNFKASLARMKEVDEHLGTSIAGAYGIRDSKHAQIVKLQYKEAGRLADALMAKGVNVWKNFKESSWAGYKPMDLTPTEDQKSIGLMEESHTGRIQMKEFFYVDTSNRFANIQTKALDIASNAGAQVDTNLANTSWTYGSYFLSPVELNDIFSPVIVNQLNDRMTTWGILTKEDHSGRSQIQFRARTKRNTTAGGYSEGTNWVYGTDFSGQVGLDKFQQPFAYYGARLALTGPARQLALAPGGLGNRWAVEIEFSTLDLQRSLNLGVIGTGAGTAENASLGFEGLFLGTTGTLYGKSLATYGTLRSHTKNESAARVDINELRFMLERVQTGTGSGTSEVFSNSGVGDLVYICHHTQERFIKSLIQDMQRLIPTSARAGFEGRIEIDGVPVFTDYTMNTDDIFLINLRNTKLGINLPPTVMPLPVTADAEAALIKIYWNLYSDAPGNNFWASNFATT